jgi:toxin-antitoxin system PIN domain toxin
VVLVDANVLLYAVNDSMSQHQRAKHWLEQALNGQESIGFAWIVLLGFLRITTSPALFPQPLRPAEAFDLIEDWLRAGPAIAVLPTVRHASLLRNLLFEVGTAGNLVTDAHLAALSLEHNASICTFDRDFGRFAGVTAFEPPA